MDVKSRWAPHVEAHLSLCGASSVEFFLNAFGEGELEKLVTDNGSEFTCADPQALLELEAVQ